MADSVMVVGLSARGRSGVELSAEGSGARKSGGPSEGGGSMALKSESEKLRWEAGYASSSGGGLSCSWRYALGSGTSMRGGISLSGSSSGLRSPEAGSEERANAAPADLDARGFSGLA